MWQFSCLKYSWHVYKLSVDYIDIIRMDMEGYDVFKTIIIMDHIYHGLELLFSQGIDTLVYCGKTKCFSLLS